ncbi:hypothetical protein [Algoriphagus namhaensis]
MSTTYKTLLFSIVALLICAYHPAFAQEEGQTESKAEIFTAKNSIFVESLWPSFSYSLNYDRIFYQKGALKLSARAGFSLLYNSRTGPTSSFWAPFIPVELTGFWGKSKHHLELGLGFFATRNRRYFFDEDFPNNIREEPYWGKTFVPRIGYRYQKPEGGFFFRGGYTPTLGIENLEGDDEGSTFNPFGLSVSLGFSF